MKIATKRIAKKTIKILSIQQMSPNSYIFSEAPNFEEDFFEKHKKHAISRTTFKIGNELNRLRFFRYFAKKFGKFKNLFLNRGKLNLKIVSPCRLTHNYFNQLLEGEALELKKRYQKFYQFTRKNFDS